jgi:hypothetical protein
LRRIPAPWAILLAAVFVVGIALRIWVYRSALGTPDSDEAVVGLMVRHVLHGQITTFFWGQGYGGIQEVLLTAPVFAVFGSSWLALRIVPMVLSAVAALLVGKLGQRLYGRAVGMTAGALFWIWPPYLVFRVVHQWGFYASGIVYSALLLLLGLRVVRSPSRDRIALFGLVLGLGFWQDDQLTPLVLPLVGWMIVKRPSSLKLAWLAAICALIGALPFLLWNLHHDWGSFSSPIANTTSYQYRLRVFVSPLMPMLFGLRITFSQVPLLSSATTDAVLAALVIAFGFGLYRARRSDASLLYAIVCVYPFIYAIAPQTLLSNEPRYLLVLTPVVVLLVAQLGRNVASAAALLGVAAALSAVNLHRMDAWFPHVAANPKLAPGSVQPLIDVLDRAHVTRVYSTFWVTYRLDFDSRERIVASQNKLSRLTFVAGRAYASHDPYIRWEPYEREVDADPRHGFVFFTPANALRRKIMAQLASHGYHRTDVIGFAVYTPPG